MTLPVNDAVPGAVRQLRQSLRAGGLAGAVAAYFRPEEDFAGLSFTCLGRNPRDAVTASDLLAVSLAAEVSVLRILDVAIWIRHSHSRAASRIRRDSGIPEPGHNRP
jgi:hypothetical protein